MQVAAMLEDDQAVDVETDAIFARLDTHRGQQSRKTVRVIASSGGTIIGDVHIDASQVSAFCRWLSKENPGEVVSMMTLPPGSQKPARFEGMDRAVPRSQADDFARWLRGQQGRQGNGESRRSDD